MKKITPLIKGIITGLILVGIGSLLDFKGLSNSSWAQYLFYALYAGGIAWTLLDYYHSPGYQATFGSIFGQGFRCFIIITLISVIYAGIGSSMRSPESKKEAATAFRAELKKEGNKTPEEIEETISNAEKHFVTGQIQLAIFGTLITGAIFTAAGAGLLLMRRK